jgi:hypothetical protein
LNISIFKVDLNNIWTRTTWIPYISYDASGTTLLIVIPTVWHLTICAYQNNDLHGSISSSFEFILYKWIVYIFNAFEIVYTFLKYIWISYYPDWSYIKTSLLADIASKISCVVIWRKHLEASQYLHISELKLSINSHGELM